MNDGMSIIERTRMEHGTLFIQRADPADELPDMPEEVDDIELDEGYGSEKLSPAMRAELYPKPPKEQRQRRPAPDQGGTISAPPSIGGDGDEGDGLPGDQKTLDEWKAAAIASGQVLTDAYGESVYGSQAEIDAAQEKADEVANAALRNQEGEVGTDPSLHSDYNGETGAEYDD